MTNGWTALMLASNNGHKEIVELLIEKGAEVDRGDEDGWTALMIASNKRTQGDRGATY